MTKKSKEILHALLYLALLISGIFAAWQVHIWWMGQGRATGEMSLQTYREDPARPAGTDLRGMLSGTRPADLAGLEPLSGDPEDLKPPAGAVRRLAFRRNLGPEEQVLARYDYPGSIEAAGSYYMECLRGRGYRLLGDASAGGRRSLIFDHDRRKVNLLLEKSRSSDDVVSMVLVLTCPSQGRGAAPSTSRDVPMAPMPLPVTTVPATGEGDSYDDPKEE